MTPPQARAKPSPSREQACDDVRDWTVIGLIVLGSALIVWVPLLV